MSDCSGGNRRLISYLMRIRNMNNEAYAEEALHVFDVAGALRPTLFRDALPLLYICKNK